MEFLESHIGRWGRFQGFTYFIGGMSCFLSGLHMMGFVFTAAVPRSRCFIGDLDDVFAFGSDWRNTTRGPYSWTTGDDIARLHYYQTGEENWCRYCPLNRASSNLTLEGIKNRTCTPAASKPCDEGMVFAEDQFSSTVVSEFQLVCAENGWKRQVLPSMTMAGVLAGTALAGTLSDRFGRRPVILAFSFLGILVYHAIIVAPNYILICIFQGIRRLHI